MELHVLAGCRGADAAAETGRTGGKLSSAWPNVVTAILLCFFIVLQAIFAKFRKKD